MKIADRRINILLVARTVEEIESYIIKSMHNLFVLLPGLINPLSPFYLFSVNPWIHFHLTKKLF